MYIHNNSGIVKYIIPTLLNADLNPVIGMVPLNFCQVSTRAS